MKEKEHIFSIRRLTMIGILGAISAFLGMTPLGFIPVGPTKATIMHIPVIIGAILEGPVVGVMVGFLFGMFSMLQNYMNPTTVSEIFLDPLVAIFPRIMIGLTSYYAYKFLKGKKRKIHLTVVYLIWIASLYYLVGEFSKQVLSADRSVGSMAFLFLMILVTVLVGYFSYSKLKGRAIEVMVTAAVGTITNTLFVLGMVYIRHGEEFVVKLGKEPSEAANEIIAIGLRHGVPETVVAMVLVTGIVIAIREYMTKEES